MAAPMIDGPMCHLSHFPNVTRRLSDFKFRGHALRNADPHDPCTLHSRPHTSGHLSNNLQLHGPPYPPQPLAPLLGVNQVGA